MKQLPRILGTSTRDFFFVIPLLLKVWDLSVTFVILYIGAGREANFIMAWLLGISPVLMSSVALGGSLFVGYGMYRAWHQASLRKAQRLKEAKFLAVEFQYVHKQTTRRIYKLVIVLGYVLLMYPVINNTWILWKYVF